MMTQQTDRCDWSEITRLAFTGNAHERRSALVEAQLHFEQFFEDEGLSLVKGDSRESLAVLVERGIITEAAELLRLQSAFRIRNQVIHKKIDLPPEEIQAAVLAFKVFLYRRNGMYHTLKQTENKDVAEHLPPLESMVTVKVRLPPPPSVSYHPEYYVNREEEESRALSCLAHPGCPVIIQGPSLFGKHALVSHVLVKLDQLMPYNLVLYDTNIEEDGLFDYLADKFSYSKTEKNQQAIEQLVVQIGKSKFLHNNIAIVVIHGLSALDKIDLMILYRIWSLSQANEEPWPRLRIVCTTSEPKTHLSRYDFNHGFNCIFLDELNGAQIGKLINLHGISSTQAVIDSVCETLGGHPYLVRSLLYEAKVKQLPVEDLILNQDTIAGNVQYIINRQSCFSYYNELVDIYNNIIPVNHKSWLENLYVAGLLTYHNGTYAPRCFVRAKIMAHFFNLSCHTVDITKPGKDAVMRFYVPIYSCEFISDDDFMDVFGEDLKIKFDYYISFSIDRDDIYMTISPMYSTTKNSSSSSTVVLGYSRLEYDKKIKLDCSDLRIDSHRFNIAYQKGFKAREEAQG